jgi:hypothetical protein
VAATSEAEMKSETVRARSTTMLASDRVDCVVLPEIAGLALHGKPLASPVDAGIRIRLGAWRSVSEQRYGHDL